MSRLQEENRKLSRQDLRPVQEAQNDISGDGIMLQRLQASLEKQRDELRLKDKLLQEKCNDIEMVRLNFLIYIVSNKLYHDFSLNYKSND